MAENTNPILPRTAPEPLVGRRLDRVSVAAIQVDFGVAENYWLELKPYPAGTTRSLWFNVSGKWVSLDDPSDEIQKTILAAFNDTSKHEVRVWFSKDEVVGLVVNSK